MGWKTKTKEVEKLLWQFLGHNESICVLYVNRGVSAIQMAMRELHTKCGSICIPRFTYHALPVTAQSYFQNIFHNNRSVIHGSGTWLCVVSPVALGGELIDRTPFERDDFLLYDCAQSCYWGMFEGIKFGPNQFAILSFEQSKPLGTPSGGGALIAPVEKWERLKELRAQKYYNPRVGQCEETEALIYDLPLPTNHDKYALETLRLRGMGCRVFNDRFKVDMPNRMTHVYTMKPATEEGFRELADMGYYPYAYNALMRKELR